MGPRSLAGGLLHLVVLVWWSVDGQHLDWRRLAGCPRRPQLFTLVRLALVWLAMERSGLVCLALVCFPLVCFPLVWLALVLLALVRLTQVLLEGFLSACGALRLPRSSRGS